MEYKKQGKQRLQIKPRLIIHGGAGNIRRENFPPEKYQACRDSLISIVEKANAFMTTPIKNGHGDQNSRSLPSALHVATYAVTLLEDNPLFNASHGAVFTRDGINELEASVMVSRGYKKRGVGVMGLRRVRNPILLAQNMLEHGEDDLESKDTSKKATSDPGLDVPSAQGHSQIFGRAAEDLAEQYGLEMVDPSYFFTELRWDEHKRALEREKSGKGLATWSATEYLPQGTVGAVALDEDGIICTATSTGGLTNKLTGRVGDTPTIGTGFWAEEWTEEGDPTGTSAWKRMADAMHETGPSLSVTDTFRGALADCFPSPLMYTPIPGEQSRSTVHTTRSIAGSGTGNGDSFLRTSALRTVAAMARWKPETGAKAVTHVAGPGGELERSAGNRWGRTGEGEGGIIGIECAIVRDSVGAVVDIRSEILMDFNCGGMFRAWIDKDGHAVMSTWSNQPSKDI